MKQCPNCRCQVDVQAASCPYCGITLPIYRKAQPFGDTRLNRVDTAVSSGTLRKSGTNQPERSGVQGAQHRVRDPNRARLGMTDICIAIIS